MASIVTVAVVVRDRTRQALTAIRARAQQLGQRISRALGDAFNRARSAAQAAGRGIASAFQAMGRAGAATGRGIGSVFRGIGRGAAATARGISRPFVASFRGIRNAYRSTVGRALSAPIRLPLRAIGRLGSGIAHALGNAFRRSLGDSIGVGLMAAAKSPPVAVAVAFLITSLAGLIGAGLSGLLITTLGLAFVSIAGVSAAKSKEVKKDWQDALKVLRKEFEEVGKPMIPVLQHGITLIENMAKRAGPAFKKAMEEAAPATQDFISRLMEGFERFGDQAFDSIMEAWEVFAPVFGELFSNFMDDLGNSFSEMADFVRNHSREVELALAAIFKVIDFVVDAVTFLGEAWALSLRTATFAIGAVIKSVGALLDAVLYAVEGILGALEFVTGKIPGMSNPLEGVTEDFRSFREDVKRKLTNAGNDAINFGKELDKMNRERKLKADIREWNRKLQAAKEKAQEVRKDAKKKAKIDADIKKLQGKINSARAEILGLTAKQYTIRFNAVVTGVTAAVDRAKAAAQAAAGARATGGVVGSYARAAAGGVRSNMTLVGEQGPELVRLPAGSQVRSNADTRRMMRGGVQRTAANIVLQSSGRRVDDMLIEILREAIHQRGGDPVSVLGGR